MKPNRFTSLTALALATGLTLGGCSDDDIATAIDDGTTATQGVDDSSNTAQSTSDSAASGDVSPAERDGLLFMREEEKLARDVYLTLYDTWNQQVFQNIANSELTHTNAILDLLTKYDIPDPVGDNPRGVFVDEELQTLHDTLVNQGYSSLIDALLVGAAIEEIDIIDIEKRKEDIIGNDDIIDTYDMLLKGSRNHLRAFVKNLNAQGIDYEPQYLDRATYDAIIGGDSETGH
jgi:hypothetical protein